MKLSLYSLSIGVALLGSIACGNSTNQSKVSGDGMGEGPGANGSSGAGDLQVTPNLGGSAATGSSGSQQVTCTAGALHVFG